MFKCILGERNSGKSIFVEDYIKKTDRNALYIATLPEIKRYEEIICRHQKRRPSSWGCVKLFDMSVEDILGYPYQNYQNVILDNLSYYILFQKYHNRDEFVKKCGDKVFRLIGDMAAEEKTTVHFVDTPIHQDMFENENENSVFFQIFNKILEKSVSIERFYSEDKICKLTVEEGRSYLFRI